MSAAPLPDGLSSGAALSQAIARAFESHQSAVPDTGNARPDPLGISEFPRLQAYVRQTRSVEVALQQVRRLAHYADGWSGSGSVAPVAGGIRDACYLLEHLTKDVKFSVDAEPDGSVNLVANGNALRVILTFEGDGRVSVATRRGGTWHDEGTFGLKVGVNRLCSAVETLVYETL